MLSIEDH